MKTKYDSMKRLLERNIGLLFECYLYLSIFVTLIGRVTPIKLMIGAGIEGMLYNALALGGGMLWVAYWLIHKNLVPKRYFVVSYAFLLVMFISSILNRQYGIFDNIKTIIWTVVQMGVLFVYPKLLGKEKIKVLFVRIWEVISCFGFFRFFNLLFNLFKIKVIG